MHRIVEFKLKEPYKIWLRYEDGAERTIDFEPFLIKGIAKELKDFDQFSKVMIEPGGGLAWENGLDFCPNYLRELQTKEEKNAA